eukprot:TRINITY_DN12807_c0_g1_i4.p1 TRINITY_DN12807_c0_g1~~TRINITY_DN12807_c0_g1_i4.p1  ORF type:complete len:259 (+),score=75.18 TRINITY_DN12807_c0_g1_i4:74-850(+)
MFCIMFRLTIIAALSCLVASTKISKQPVSFIGALKFKQTLRLCNAYPSEKAIQPFKDEKAITGKLKFKDCNEIEVPLESGSRIEFKTDGGIELGTFTVSDLPEYDATLLLAVHRRDVSTTAVAFTSHIFAPSQQAQLACLDTYSGVAKGKTVILDGSKTETLEFGSVVGINAGSYKVALKNEDGVLKESKMGFDVKASQNYVVIRTGLAGTKKFEQDLIVFPKGAAEVAKVEKVRSGAAAAGPACLVVMALLALAAAQ